MTTVSIVVAMSAKDRIIGSEGGMPWKLKNDLQRFKQITTGKPIIMGRKTYESIGKPLPNRTNIVVSRDATFRPEGVVVYDSLDRAIIEAKVLAKLTDSDEVCVIGGGEIYRQALPYTDKVYATYVFGEDITGDTSFPELPQGFLYQGSYSQDANDDNSHYTVYTLYIRKDK